MLIAFPHMGNGWPAFKSLCERMGADIYMPDANNVRQIEQGLRNSPEWVCFPFKTTLANMIQALDAGADTIAMITDCGPCRLGFYYAVQERILKDKGYTFSMKHLPQADLLTFEWVTFLRSICQDPRRMTISNLFLTVRIFLMKSYLVAFAEDFEGRVRCYEACSGDTTRALKKSLLIIDDAKTVQELKRAKRDISRLFLSIPRKQKNEEILRVGFTGEIFILLDDFSNHGIKRKLGEMGCEVVMGTSVYEWVKHKLHINFSRKYLEYLSRQHQSIGSLPLDIGGEAIWVLGEYIEWSQEEYDGFVHVYPFTCMPEITAKSIINSWYGKGLFTLPPFFFSFDEHSGEAGLITRLESYLDLIRRKKQEKRFRSA
ncbi:MAG: hypothetical protein WDA18_00930 [Candidatus Ratteibacteria bacterium]